MNYLKMMMINVLIFFQKIILIGKIMQVKSMKDFDEQNIESIIDFKFCNDQRQKYLKNFITLMKI